MRGDCIACDALFDKGITCECFQMSANLPSLKDLLNKILNGTETSLATGFNIL